MKSLRSRRFVWFGVAVWVLAASCTWAVMIWPKAVFGLAGLLAVASLFVALGLRPTRKARPPREHAPRVLPPEPAPERRSLAPIHYPLLRPEDEAEVERLYQRLKAVGRLDSRSSSDET